MYMGKTFNILCGISKDTFEIPHKISYPRKDSYVILKFNEHLNLRANSYVFLNRPPAEHSTKGLITRGQLIPDDSHVRIYQKKVFMMLWQVFIQQM